MSELLAFWKNELEKLDTEHILRWTFDMFGSQVAFAPSWGLEDILITSELEKRSETIPSVDLVCHLLLPETWTPLKPNETLHHTFDGRVASVDLWTRFHLEHLCKRHERVIRRYQAWIVSSRREQDAMLNNMSILSWNERFGVFRIAPLVRWRAESIDKKIRQCHSPSIEPHSDRQESRILSTPIEDYHAQDQTSKETETPESDYLELSC